MKTPKILQQKTTYTVDYPAAVKYAETQMDIFWHPNEIEVEKDLHDLMTNFTEAERHGVVTTLKLFTLYELIVGTEYWSGIVKKLFPRPADIQRMASCFSFFEENVHAPFYNKLNEVLGLNTDEFYNSYVNDEVLSNRINWIHKVINKPSDNVYDILKSVAVFSMIEGAVLYSSFAFLKHFQAEGKNKLVNVTAGINFSVRDENCLIEGTEVLTYNGWKPIEHVTLSDRICQYDPVSKYISYDKPTQLFHTKAGEYYEFTGKNYHQVVTPEHRMITNKGIHLAKDCSAEYDYVLNGFFVGEILHSESILDDVKKMLNGDLTTDCIYDKIGKISSIFAAQIIELCLNRPESITPKIRELLITLANISGGVIQDDSFVEMDNEKVEIIHHQGDLKNFYCLNVPTTAFLVRSNGKISVTGNCHSEAGAWLFKTLLSESELSKEDIEKLHLDILETAEHIKEHEDRIIGMIFEKGSIKGITDHQLKSFIQHRLDVCLEQLGFKKHFNPSYNPIKNWFYKNINSPQLHDFFYKIGNQYNRDWNEHGFIWKVQ